MHAKSLSPSHLAALLDGADDLIWSVDRSCRLVAGNVAFHAFYRGVSGGAELAAGSSALAGLPPELAATLRACYEGALAGERACAEIVWGEKALAVTVAPLLVDGSVDGAGAYARDVTRQRRHEEELGRLLGEQQEANRVLQAHNAELSAYTQTVAHDLKNPLAGVLMSAEFLLQRTSSPTDGGIQTRAELMRELAARAVAIVDELLLLAQRRHAAIESEPLDMAAIVQGVCSRFVPLIEARRATVDIATSLPPALGHAALVESVWENYLSNGLKYGGQPPHLTLGATPQPSGLVRYWVRDRGPGIAPGVQSRLFAEYSRPHERRAEGQGLGLSIVRRLVEGMGGAVGVESEPGKGSCFYFLLPAADREHGRSQ